MSEIVLLYGWNALVYLWRENVLEFLSKNVEHGSLGPWVECPHSSVNIFSVYLLT